MASTFFSGAAWRSVSTFAISGSTKTSAPSGRTSGTSNGSARSSASASRPRSASVSALRRDRQCPLLASAIRVRWPGVRIRDLDNLGMRANPASDSFQPEPHPRAFLVLVLFEPSGFGWQRFAKGEI